MCKAIRLATAAGLIYSGCFAALSAEESKEAAASNRQEELLSVEQEKPLTAEEIQQLSKAFGHFIGRNLKAPGITFNLEAIIDGMRQGAEGKAAPMSDQEYEKMMARLQLMAFRQLSHENLKAANDFLDTNKKESDVKVLDAGKVQYKVLEEGHGDAIQEHSTPKVEYVGKYLDGTVFGSSKDTGGAIVIPLDQTIPGFSKGLIGMKEGEKRRIFVHPDLGYGTSGHLPPNSLLIFDVEVIKPQSTKEEIAVSSEESDLDDDEDDNESREDEDEDHDHHHHSHHHPMHKFSKEKSEEKSTERKPSVDHSEEENRS